MELALLQVQLELDLVVVVLTVEPEALVGLEL
jgi:hypothetical protein